MDKYRIVDEHEEEEDNMPRKYINLQTNQKVKIKSVKVSQEDQTTAKKVQLELKILKQLQHSKHITKFIELIQQDDIFYFVYEDFGENLLYFLDKKPNGLDSHLIQNIIYQLLKAIQECHQNNIIHRDLKLETIFMCPTTFEVKIERFKSARYLPENTSSSNQALTDYVYTRWYRSPEILLDANYGKPSDIWAVGCILAELTDGNPLFPGESEIDQIFIIQKMLGTLTPEEQGYFNKKPQFKGVVFPKINMRAIEDRYGNKFQNQALDLVKGMLKMNPAERITAEEAIKHSYFDEIRSKEEGNQKQDQVPSQEEQKE